MIETFSFETLNINYHINIVMLTRRKFHFLKNRVNLELVLLTAHIAYCIVCSNRSLSVFRKNYGPEYVSVTAHGSGKMDWYFIAALLLVSVIGMLGNIFAIFVVVRKSYSKKEYGLI